jgi:hypothetical protein
VKCEFFFFFCFVFVGGKLGASSASSIQDGEVAVAVEDSE